MRLFHHHTLRSDLQRRRVYFIVFYFIFISDSDLMLMLYLCEKYNRNNALSCVLFAAKQFSVIFLFIFFLFFLFTKFH